MLHRMLENMFHVSDSFQGYLKTFYHCLILCLVVFYNPNLILLYVIKIIDVTNKSRNLIHVTPQRCQSNNSTSRPVR